MTLSLIVYDLDGTLVDSLGDLRRSLNLTLAESGCGSLSLAEVRSMVGDGVENLIARAFAATRCTADPALALRRYLAHYESDPVAKTQVYPGVPAALAAQRAAGVRLALLTNKLMRSTQMVLERLELAEYFSRVVGGDSLPFRKPDPRTLLEILNGFNVKPDEALMVGDSEVDAATARAARVPFALMSYGYHRVPVEEIPSVGRFADFEALGRFVDAQAR